MSPEQQREQWLKRALPALVITVLYFAIGSGFVTSKFKKAQDEYILMQSKGINASALPAKEQQQIQLKADAAKLEEEDKKIHSEMAKNSSFLDRTASQNDTLDQLSVLLANHHLQVIEEKRNDKTKDALSLALRDTQKWLAELFPANPPADNTAKDKKEADLAIWTVQYVGNYVDTYHALNALANSQIRVLPVSLTMQPLKNESGKLAWTLNLWL